MRGSDWIAGLLATPAPLPRETASVRDVLEFIGGTGRDAGRRIAEALGVKVDTARAYRRGIRNPERSHRSDVRTRFDEAAAEVQAELDTRRAEDQAAVDAEHRQQTADFLRLISRVTPGTVEIREISGKNRGPKANTRTIGQLDHMGPGMERVARAWERGDESAAEVALSDAVVNRYGGGYSGSSQGLAASLRIVDYPEGLDYN